MLSRTADNIYWMARMVERAQDIVRLLEAAYRMEQLPGGGAGWDPILTISGQIDGYKAKYDTPEYRKRRWTGFPDRKS